MDVVYILLPISLVLSLCALAAFLWSIRSGQLDDLETPARRVALDDDLDQPKLKPAPDKLTDK